MSPRCLHRHRTLIRTLSLDPADRKKFESYGANERKSMNNKFDELTKSMAQSVTRRAALKKFGVGLAGMALACFGLANKARAATYSGYCEVRPDFVWPGQKGKTNWSFTGTCYGVDPVTGHCLGASNGVTGGVCPSGQQTGKGQRSAASGACAGVYWVESAPCSFTS